MPRALLVRPGPNFSVSDVADGWKQGLLANGYDVLEYNTDERLTHFGSSYRLNAQNRYELAIPDDQAVTWLAMEPLKGFLFDWWPDLVVVISGFFWMEHLTKVIQGRGMKLVFVFTESPYQEDTQFERASDGCDLAVLNDPTHLDRYRDAGIPVTYVPHSYRPTLHYPAPAAAGYESDVCFVGTGYPSRIEFLERVDWSGIDLALCGNWASFTDAHPLAQHVRGITDKVRSDRFPVYELCIDNRDTVRWYRGAKASLNLYRREADRPELSDGWSMGPREVELSATGCFFLTEARPENRQVLPFVPTFASPDECGELLRWFLARPDARADIVARARAAVAEWTLERRVADVLRLVDRSR